MTLKSQTKYFGNTNVRYFDEREGEREKKSYIGYLYCLYSAKTKGQATSIQKYLFIFIIAGQSCSLPFSIFVSSALKSRRRRTIHLRRHNNIPKAKTFSVQLSCGCVEIRVSALYICCVNLSSRHVVVSLPR
jgi:hypothetical protein